MCSKYDLLSKDSMVSSLTYGLYLHHSNPKKEVVPLFNINKKDFPLRTETDHYLNKLGVKIESVLFLEDVDLRKLQQEKRLELVLVDHNTLGSKQEYLAPR